MASLQPLIPTLSFFTNLLLHSLDSSHISAGTITEGEQIALESGELLPPKDLSSRITKDLSAIRSKFNDVSNATHHGNFVPGELKIVLLNTKGFKVLEDINASEFGPSESRKVLGHGFEEFITIFIVTFGKPYNPIKLLKALGLEDFQAGPSEVAGDLPYSITLTNSTVTTGRNTYEFKKLWKLSTNTTCEHDLCSYIECDYQHFWTFIAGPEDNSVQFVEPGGNKLTADITISDDTIRRRKCITHVPKNLENKSL